MLLHDNHGHVLGHEFGLGIPGCLALEMPSARQKKHVPFMYSLDLWFSSFLFTLERELLLSK